MNSCSSAVIIVRNQISPTDLAHWKCEKRSNFSRECFLCSHSPWFQSRLQSRHGVDKTCRSSFKCPRAACTACATFVAVTFVRRCIISEISPSSICENVVVTFSFSILQVLCLAQRSTRIRRRRSSSRKRDSGRRVSGAFCATNNSKKYF